MRSVSRRNAGLNLIELQITIAILFLLLVVVALFVYGPEWGALKMILGVPLALVACATAVSLAVGSMFKVQEIRGVMRVRRALALAREGLPEAEQAARELPWRSWTDDLIARHRDELVTLLSTRARFAALVLLIKAEDRNPPDCDAALIASADLWPEDLLFDAWKLTRSAATRLALAPVFLPRGTAATRTRILADLFATYSLRPVPDPSEDWLRVLAPYEAEIAALTTPSAHHTVSHMSEPRVAAYAAAFAAAKRPG